MAISRNGSSSKVNSNLFSNSIIGKVMQYGENLNILYNRTIGKNLYYRSITNKDLTLVRNPYQMRYTNESKDILGIDSSAPNIGEKYEVYGDERIGVFLDDVGGLSGFTNGGYIEAKGDNTKVTTAMNTVLGNISGRTYSNEKPYIKFTQESGKTGTIDEDGFTLSKYSDKISTLDSVNDYSKASDLSEHSLLRRTSNIINRVQTTTSGRLIGNQNKRGWGRSKKYENLSDTTGVMEGYEKSSIQTYQEALGISAYRPYKGESRLGSMSVLNGNGTVNMTPYGKSGTLDKDSIKRCMFSIENLAWKDVKTDTRLENNAKNLSIRTQENILTEEQRGPNGGRIMWFPPYNLKFNENISTNWDSNSFIGRGEKVYTYIDTERTGTLNFTIVVDHPSVLNKYIIDNGNGTLAADEDILKYFAGESLLPVRDSALAIEDENTGQKSVKEKKTITEKKTMLVFFPYGCTGSEYLDTYETSGKTCTEWTTDCGNNIYDNVINYNLNTKWNSDLYTDIEDTDIITYSQIISFKSKQEFMDYLLNNTKEKYVNIKSYEIEAKIEGYQSDIEVNNCNVENNFLETENMNDSDKESRANIAKERCTTIKNIISNIVDTVNINNTTINEANDYVVQNKGEKLNQFVRVDFNITVEDSVSFTSQQNETLPISSKTITDKNGEKTTFTASTTIVTLPPSGTSVENEYLYFKNLAEKDKIIVSEIKNKVQYFDPAFHSITPEGFNARLNFLNQCTRQGPTLRNDSQKTNASNLAFGRPPFCILRIGDFYNTKILIDSVSIDYDNGGGVSWDLNPEGIGVQPMLANITLGIKFLGGSELSGPVEKLQNAISSNFYANTSVYDARASFRQAFYDGKNNGENDLIEWNNIDTGN